MIPDEGIDGHSTLASSHDEHDGKLSRKSSQSQAFFGISLRKHIAEGQSGDDDFFSGEIVLGLGEAGTNSLGEFAAYPGGESWHDVRLMDNGRNAENACSHKCWDAHIASFGVDDLGFDFGHMHDGLGDACGYFGHIYRVL